MNQPPVDRPEHRQRDAQRETPRAADTTESPPPAPRTWRWRLPVRFALWQARKATGSTGERAARRYLRRELGFRTIRSRLDLAAGEIDLLMEDPRPRKLATGRKGPPILVVVEVRTRTLDSNYEAVTPEQSVGPQKGSKLVQLATELQAMLRNHRRWSRASIRIDVVAVDLYADGSVASVRHFERAVELDRATRGRGHRSVRRDWRRR